MLTMHRSSNLSLLQTKKPATVRGLLFSFVQRGLDRTTARTFAAASFSIFLVVTFAFFVVGFTTTTFAFFVVGFTAAAFAFFVASFTAAAFAFFLFAFIAAARAFALT